MSENACKTYDLIEYKLKKYVDSFYQGTDEWETAMQVLLMYLDGQIDVRWSSEGIIVGHPSSLQKKSSKQQEKIIVPVSGNKEV